LVKKVPRRPFKFKKKSRRASKNPKFYADFTKSGGKVSTQFCFVCPHVTINTSVKLENRRVVRKWRLLTQVMAANFKPNSDVKNAMFIFELFWLHLM
jgi:hypothetical protein